MVAALRGPESLTTLPSGARLPRRIAIPPVALIGLASGDDLLAGVSGASGMLADRLAGHGGASGCEVAALSSRLASTAVPPAACRSVATKRPPGWSQGSDAVGDPVEVVDVELDAHLAGDREQFRTPLVEPPGADGHDRVLEAVRR